MKANYIERIPQAMAAPFIEKWHYSNRCPTGKNIFFGWFVQSDTYGLESYQSDLLGMCLYAVADYGIGVNPYQANSLARQTGLPIVPEQLLELKRLCRIEPKVEQLQLTQFLSKCHRELAKEGYKYIVSFSDPGHGHNGGIYAAANFSHIGKTGSETHAKDKDGEVRHRRLYFRYARRNGISVARAREELGLTPVKTLPKDRWLIQIGKPGTAVRENGGAA